MARIAWLVVGVVVLGLVAAAVWVATVDPNQHKASIERWASDALGESVRIEGPITLRRGPTSTLVLNGLRIGATDQAPPVASIQRVEISLVLTSLLWGPLHLPTVVLDTAELELPFQTGASSLGAGEAPVPEIDRLEASKIKVRYRKDDGEAVDFAVESAVVAPSADRSSTTLHMTATVAELPLKVTGTTGPVATLFASGQGLPIDIEATLGDGKLDLSGSLSLQGGELAYRLDSKLALPADSKLAASLALPALPLAATAKLQGDRSAVAIQALSATSGKSDLAGDVTWQVGQAEARGKLSGKLAAKRINPAELGLGAGAAQPAKADGGVVPDLALPSPASLAVDLDLGVTIAQLDLPGNPITDLAGTASADQAKLDLSVTQAKLSGGALQASYRASGAVPDVTFALDAKRIDLASLTVDPNDGGKLPEDVNLKVDLSGQGAALRAALGSAQGTIALDIGAAVINEALINLLGQSLFTALLPSIKASSGARIICGVLDLEATAGKARSTALVIDGDRIVVGGGGAIDLATGKIDFVLLPKAKNATLAPLVAPVHLIGTIIDPQVAGDAGSILSSAGHLLLGIVNPLSLATPVLHPDLQGNAPCLNPSAVQRSDPIEEVGGTAIDAVEDTAKGVGSALEQIGKGAGKLLEDITGN